MKYFFTIAFTWFSLFANAQEFKMLNTSSITINGTSTLFDWEVKAEKHRGSILINAKKSNKSFLKKGNISALSITVKAEDILSERGETMDNKMHRALKKDKHPKILYTLASSTKFILINKTKRTIKVAGAITIAGVEKIIISNLEVSFANGILTLLGAIPLKLSDFDIDPPSAMFGQIETGNDITVNFICRFEK